MKVRKRIKEYKEIFNGQPWYGTSVLETLRSVSWEIVNERLQNKSHSIAELVQHMLNWRKFVIEKLNQNVEFEIALNGSLDWPEALFIKDEYEWESLVNELIHSQEEISEALLKKNEDWLFEKTPSKEYSNDFLIRGIIYHDIYHLGQIRLIYSVIKSI